MDDIRKKPILRENDIHSLNFIREQKTYIFRRHHRSGLRSHILEMLSAKDVKNETRGVVIDGLRWFPRARPLKMLRIFRRFFKNLSHAMEEIQRFKMIVKYLTPEHLAMSEEFLVAYAFGQESDILLCGLQEYVHGENLDPWTMIEDGYVEHLVTRLLKGKDLSETPSKNQLAENIKKNTDSFVKRIKTMIIEKSHVPDLAGVRNILVTGEGQVKLVDINNISIVSRNDCVITDDIGYPVCDKSIEALSLIEKIILGREIEARDSVYATLFQSRRQSEIKKMDRRFHESNQKNL